MTQRLPRVLRRHHVSEPPAGGDDGAEAVEVNAVVLDAERLQGHLRQCGEALTAAELCERLGMRRDAVNRSMQLLVGAGLARSDGGRPAARYRTID